jgi:Fe2+ transport system protein FeoA
MFPSRKLSSEVGATLDGAVVGGRVSIVGFDGAMSTGHRELLRAYGIEPGRTVRVEQHAPVTVVQVDQTEVALEADLAKRVFGGAIR